MSTPRIPTEAAEAIFPRRESDVAPINCQALMALAVIESPLLQPGGKVKMEDLLTAAAICIGGDFPDPSGHDTSCHWVDAIERRDAKALRRLAIAQAREIGPDRLQELGAAIARQIERGLGGLVPLKAADAEGPIFSPLLPQTAGRSPKPSTTGAGRSSSPRRSSANTASPGKR